MNSSGLIHYYCTNHRHLWKDFLPFTMQYNNLGKSDLKVSEISFGCMSLDSWSPGSIALLEAAYAAGINFFDTADLYEQGASELMLGKFIRDKRKDIILATKGGNQLRSDGSGWDWNPRKKYILSAAEESLKRLQTDYIDLYQLHGGTMQDPMDETIEAFEQLKQEGKIRHYGISSIRPAVIKEYISGSTIASVMMQYSLLDRRPEQECLALIQASSKGMIARGSLAKGLLSNKRAAKYLDHSAGSVEEAQKLIRQLSGPERSPAQTALRFVLYHEAVTTAVVGIRTHEHLTDAIGATECPALSVEEWKLLSDGVKASHYQL